MIDLTNIFKIIGCISIFLFGISILTATLENVADKKLQNILCKITSNSFKSLFIGIFVSALIQSSSAVTAILISMVAANLISLKSAFIVIMGANIGTTITTVLTGLDIQQYCYIILAIGVFLYLFINIKQIKQIGSVVIGVGLIFLGLYLIEDALINTFNSEVFLPYIIKADKNLWLGSLVGTIISASIQSSSSTIALTQELFNHQIISLPLSLAIMLGANVGTTFTGLVASLNTSFNSKVLATCHLLYNVFGVIIAMILIKPLTNFSYYIYNTYSPNLAISFAHILFNVISSIIGLFMVSSLLYISKKLVSFSTRNIFKKNKNELYVK